MTFDIHIKQGIGELEFDMPIEKIIPILGEADEVETIENAIDECLKILGVRGVIETVGAIYIHRRTAVLCRHHAEHRCRQIVGVQVVALCGE